jgi:uncharacterized repeat protein (TIGR01451 family)
MDQKVVVPLLSAALFTSLAGIASASIAIDQTISKDQGSASATVSTGAFSTTSGNELLLAFVSGDAPASGTNTVVTGLAGGGLVWVLAQRTNTQLGTAEIWRAFAPSPLASVTVTATLSSSVVSSITVMTFTGVDTTGTSGSGAIGAQGSANSGGGAPTASLATTRANSLVLGVGNDWDKAINRTPGTGQTVVHQDLSPTGDTYWVQRQSATTAAIGTSVTINDTAPTGDRYNLAIVEILASATAPSPADLTLSKSHVGNFVQGQTGAIYTLTVANSGGTATSGAVTVVDALPTGLTPTSMAGANWNCALATLTCTRSDALAAGASYPPITLTVNVANTAPASVTNIATVSGGGETNTGNDTASDVTTIVPLGVTSIKLVQRNVNGNEAATTSMSVAFTSANTSGDFLVVTGSAARPATTLAVSDTLGNSYLTAFGPVTDPAQNVTIYIWFVPMSKGGANSVTITPSGPAALEIHVSEWSGLASASPVDQTAWATGSGAAVSSGALTTTADGELVFGYAWVLNTATAGTGFTPMSLINGDLDEYQIQPAAGSVAATFSQTSGTWFAAMVTFRPASAAAPILSVAPQTLNFTASVGGSNPPPTTISVTNAGGGPLNFTAASDSPWLAVSPGSGTAPQSVQATASVSGLAAGSYTGHVTISSPGAQASPTIVTATLVIASSTGTGTLSIDVTVSKDNGVAGSAIVSPSFSTASPNELLLAFVGSDYQASQSSTNVTVTGISGGGLTWALVQRANAQSGTAEIWRAFAPSVLTGVTVTATLSQSVQSSMTVMAFIGVDTSGTNGSGAIGAVVGRSASSGAPSATLVTTRSNSWVVGAGDDYDNAIARTVGAGNTLVHQYLSPINDTYWVQRQAAATPLAGTSVTINDTAPTTDRYNLSICEILPAAVQTPTTTITPAATSAVAPNSIAPPPALTVSPRAVALTFSSTQQFTVQNGNGPLTWSVDGVTGGSSTTGTVAQTGIYTPPSAAGVHMVTATTADRSQSASALVYVTNYPGTFTYHNDNLRTGQNIGETVLTPANVNSSQFGKLFSYPTDGVAYASPLYVANVNIPGKGFRNAVYVATAHDSVYAFDADNPSSSPLWKASFLLGAGVSTVPPADVGDCCDMLSEIGITGTPVIDAAGGTLYVVAKTKEVARGAAAYVQRLHALDIATGVEKLGGPVVIQASVPGSGDGTVAGRVQFDPLHENQRPGLLLSNGVIYIGFGSHADGHPWHGWLLGYSATSLEQVMVYNDTANGYGGGIWQSGGAPAADGSGNLFVATGNGTFDANTGGVDYADSIQKLSPAGVVLDYFTPHDESNLSVNDLDLGSAGPIVLVNQTTGSVPHLMIAAGKGGTIYVLNRDNMGHYNAVNDGQIAQSIVGAFPFGARNTGNFSAPVYFNGSVYFGAVNDSIKAFQLSQGALSTVPLSQTAETYPNRGGTFAISANGAADGILWAVQDNGSGTPGVLRAYDAANLASELYNSSQAGSRDTLDVAAKFNVPLVANGKIFVVTQNTLIVYGLLP